MSNATAHPHAGSRHPRPHRQPHLRAAIARARRRRRGGRAGAPTSLPLGARLADAVAAVVGSWPFIAAQSAALLAWIVVNVALGPARGWDPYPFILLNLLLSFQAAYTAPIIMMSQNRQTDIDRDRAVADYQINLRAEAEVALLHEKIDLLRETEVRELVGLLRHALERLEALERRRPPVAAPGGGAAV